jgi:hypothetical protein
VPSYTLRNHRIGAAAGILIAGIVGGAGAAWATYSSYRDEVIREYQVDATLDGDTVSMVETIDYDFGSNARRGIFREVDLGILDESGRVEIRNTTAATESANDELKVTDDLLTATLRVGDPDITHRGLHRYQLGYDLVGVPDPQTTGRFVLVAIGDRWEVPIEDVTVRFAPDFEPGDVQCSQGSSRGFDPCEVSVDDGVISATAPRIASGEGLVLEVEAGSARTPAVLDPPSLQLDGTSNRWLGATVAVGAVAAGAGALGSLLAGRWVRRAGADLSGALSNPSEAAYATGTEGERISDSEAIEHVTVQFAPPEGLTPPQGAIVERERVDDAAKTAWLAQAVIDGWIDLEGDSDKPTMVHTERADRDPAHMPAPLAAAFNGRREVELGQYDQAFASGWGAIDGQLEAWRRSSGLWDEARARRNHATAGALLGLGVLSVAVVGIALIAGLGRVVPAALLATVVAGLFLGAGVRAMAGAPTLAVRTPAGFGLWLRTEGFRRFLAESEGQHARWAADHGLLREYSAWAVALGELDRWNRATAQAGIAPTDPALATTAAFVGLSHSARTTSVKPSSSGSGGGGFSGGGFSGGVGGGGGGSW